jgi:hypothetical protein
VGRSLKDLSGTTLGRVTVLHRTRELCFRRHYVMYACRCVCGTEFIANVVNLRSGDTRSCGCLQRERLAEYHRRRRASLAA